MDENIENDVSKGKEGDVNNLTMDESGKIHEDRHGAAVIEKDVKTYQILGWISAAFTALISPLFVIAGIVFGVLANRKKQGSGNAIIITNVVLAVLNMLVGFFLLRGLMFGY